MKLITLSRNMYAKVDDDMFDILNKYCWYAHSARTTFYARRDTKQGAEFMHHYVIGVPISGYETDHINNDGLDTRRSNLRNITHRQNIAKQQGRSSIFPGVRWDKRHSVWRSDIRINGTRIYLGISKCASEAFLKYRDAILSIGEELLPEHEDLYLSIKENKL